MTVSTSYIKQSKILDLGLESEFPIAWYPIAKSSSLKKGGIQKITLLKQNWLLFRTKNGSLGIVDRYCSHMGADLARGKVCQEKIRCPLHQWEYDINGYCTTKVPENLKTKATLKSLTIFEFANIIFVYPEKELPYTPRIFLKKEPFKTSSVSTISIPINFLIPAINTFDAAHYEIIHKRKLSTRPKISSHHQHHLSIQFSAQVTLKRLQDRFMHICGFNTVDIKIDCWGATVFVMYNKKAKLGAIIAINSTELMSSDIYVTAFTYEQPNSILKKIVTYFKLEVSRILTIIFLKADIPFVRGMLPKEGILIPGQDDEAKQFWQYYKKLPKIRQNVK